MDVGAVIDLLDKLYEAVILATIVFFVSHWTVILARRMITLVREMVQWYNRWVGYTCMIEILNVLLISYAELEPAVICCECFSERFLTHVVV